VRFKNLSELRRPGLREIFLAALPKTIAMSRYAKEKAFKINELVNAVYRDSLEWYGFTLGASDEPDLVVDIGLPRNDLNLQTYTALSAERIAQFREALPADVVINGWIHSHGALGYKHFSTTDERNHLVVLDYVVASLRRPVAKREILIKDLVFLQEGRFDDADMTRGSVCIITDAPVSSATIMETIYGGYCYAVVIGNEGWHEQQIYYRESGVLSGSSILGKSEAEISLVDTGMVMTRHDISDLEDEVRAKIQPNPNPPVEMTERM
jgi:hypothetical protein